MANLTNKEKIVLRILKSPEKNYNANNLSKEIGISSMGCLKILKNLENDGIVQGKRFGRALFYRILFNRFSESYLSFILNAEKEKTSAYVKRWSREIEKIRGAQIAILFGSVLAKGEKARDIDVVFIVQPKNLSELKKEIEKINNIAEKRIHPIYQTISDFKKNILQGNPAILESIKGLILIGQDKFIFMLKEEK